MSDSAELLEKWLLERDVDLSSCSIHHFPETGRGLMAKKTITKGTPILSIPFDLLITTRQFMLSPPPTNGRCCDPTPCARSGHCHAFLARLYAEERHLRDPVLLLVGFLLHHMAMGEASPFYPYLHTLPCTYSIPVYFPPVLLAHYAPDEGSAAPEEGGECTASGDGRGDADVLHIHRTRRRKVREQMRTLQALHRGLCDLSRACPALFRVHGCQETTLSLHAVRWAWSSLMTRCVYTDMDSLFPLPAPRTEGLGPDVYGMAPWLDMINHRDGAQTKGRYDPATHAYLIVAEEDFAPGQQIFISYGPHGNERLLAEYGFVHDSISPHDVLLIPEPLLEAQLDRCPASDAIRAFLKSLIGPDFMQACSIQWSPPASGGAPRTPELSWALATTLRTIFYAIHARTTPTERWRAALLDERGLSRDSERDLWGWVRDLAVQVQAQCSHDMETLPTLEQLWTEGPSPRKADSLLEEGRLACINPPLLRSWFQKCWQSNHAMIRGDAGFVSFLLHCCRQMGRYQMSLLEEIIQVAQTKINRYS
ncbi:hypothetical protein PAPYR_7320 [Paratrimastix pyriformis]|uniref:SET domain-containing protein n=1 Tax=Paratrimastix pyriformis TaxID=342808 RepID=A0ABQ8UH88_9EUKA|nr:hypothetical protein PAPYR_7320 [Paratrimastix pyriformis]